MWNSRTERFIPEEMAQIETQSFEQLARRLKKSLPIVVIRVLVELNLHDDMTRLDPLLRDAELTKHWYDDDFSMENGYDFDDLLCIVGLINHMIAIGVLKANPD